MEAELLSPISDVETIASGGAIHDLARIIRAYGAGRWRKLKGTATVRLPDGEVASAEVHWYEAHGIGRKEVKIKRLLS